MVESSGHLRWRWTRTDEGWRPRERVPHRLVLISRDCEHHFESQSCLLSMAEVQSSLPANAAPAMPTSGVDKDALIARLDTLLEQYLHTLDSYEKLMQQLSKQLSSVRSRPPYFHPDN